MNTSLSTQDFAALSPLLILLMGALLVLLTESFAKHYAKALSFFLTLITLGSGLYASLHSPGSENPLLTPWLRFDSLTTFFTVFFLSVGLLSLFLSTSFFQKFEATHGEYNFLLLTALFGLVLIAASADFLTLFLGLETLSIALYILCGYMKKWTLSSEAALKYLLMGAIGASLLLYGIALIYGATGTTQFSPLLSKYSQLASSSHVLFLGGIALVTIGLAFKAAVVPFHVWAPDVYCGAPTPVTAFMSVGTKAGAFAGFIRVFMEALPHFDPLWNQAVSWLAILTLLYANFVALQQFQLRRFFAYSGISHAGFLLIPLAAETSQSLEALLFYLVVYGLSTLGAFAVLSYLDKNSEGATLNSLRGLFRQSPLLAGLLSLCLLTLGGIPPTVGFFAKFYLFKVGFEAGLYTLVIIGLLTTILSAFYYLRMIGIMFADAPEEKESLHISWPAALVGCVSAIGLLLFSIFPSPLLEILGVVHS